MQSLPRWAHRECEKCHEPIAYVQTNRRSKGAPVEIAVDFEPDPGTGGTVLVALVSSSHHADALVGNPVPKRQAEAMRAAGQHLRAEHAMTCKRRSGSHRRDA